MENNQNVIRKDRRSIRFKVLTALFAFMSVMTVVVLIFTWNMAKQIRYEIEQKDMSSTIDQVISLVDRASVNKEATIELFSKDYLNRINLLDYFLKQDPQTIISNDLLTVFELAAAFQTDTNGMITTGSNDQLIGMNIEEITYLSAFKPLLTAEKGEHLIVFEDRQKGINNTYIGKRNTNGLTIVEALPSLIDNYLSSTDIANVIKNIPTKSYETIIAYDAQNASLLGISENNDQNLDQKVISDAILSAGDRFQIIDINGKPSLFYAKTADGITYCVFSHVEDLLLAAHYTIIIGVAFVILFCLLIGLFIYLLIKTIVLDDFYFIVDKMTAFCNGDKNIRFKAKKTSEMTLLSDKLNDVLKVIETRGERISEIASFMGNGFGAYEYFPKLNQFYYSDSLIEILGIDADEIKKMVVDFYQEHGLSEDDNEKIEEYQAPSGRYVRAIRSIHKEGVYTFIEDITKQKTSYRSLKDRLEIATYRNQIDSLTELANRQKIKEDISKAEGKGIVILLDIDNFKKVNDTIGHGEGDRLLIALADIIRKSFRPSDTKARLGGDEFMIFIPEAMTPSHLAERMDRFMQAIHSDLAEYYEKFQLSVSIGIVYIEGEDTDFAKLYQKADEAMYQVKKSTKDGYYIVKKEQE